jgi:DNA-3-methyladenine glycosylase
MGIGAAENGLDALDPQSPVTVGPGGPDTADSDRPTGHRRMASGPRVGLKLAADRPWRFWIEGEPTVSTYRSHPRRLPGDDVTALSSP